MVYVDSGSNDDSIALARACGAEVVELATDLKFTAARARNAGFRHLTELNPDLRYVFFVDGDCEVAHGWLKGATQFLDQHKAVAAVSGLRRERFPEKSIYNLLIDIEWRNYPAGESMFCGGDALMRTQAFKEVDGYRPDLICGEEPEMCFRLRRLGWRIWRLNEPMTLHDAAMYRFPQWWMREMRTGYAFAQGARLHGDSPERHSVKETRRAWIWGIGLPLAAALGCVAYGELGALIFLVYPAQVTRLALTGKRSPRENWSTAAALVLGKFPQMIGGVKYFSDLWRDAPAQLIEYK